MTVWDDGENDDRKARYVKLADKRLPPVKALIERHGRVLQIRKPVHSSVLHWLFRVLYCQKFAHINLTIPPPYKSCPTRRMTPTASPK